MNLDDLAKAIVDEANKHCGDGLTCPWDDLNQWDKDYHRVLALAVASAVLEAADAERIDDIRRMVEEWKG